MAVAGGRCGGQGIGRRKKKNRDREEKAKGSESRESAGMHVCPALLPCLVLLSLFHKS